jgi:putative nucleotidyltransferase with HDIG domain
MITDNKINWKKVEATPWWQALAACPQDPKHHGEGDVATHTRMVVEALEADPRFAELDERAQRVLRLAALLHDAGKPATTKHEAGGRITSNGHARIGAYIARRLLWEQGADFAEREAVCALVRWHMRPGYCLDSDDPERTAITIAQTARCDWLTLLAEADTRGRIAPGTEDALVRVGLFGELCKELGVWNTPYAFPSPHSRVVYFRTPGRARTYEAYDDTKGELVLMSGLPGSGKDTYIQQQLAHLPVVSLDVLRKELGIAPSDPQEPVALAALERARVYLRQKQDFVWNATNLRHELRARPLGLAADYNFRVKIVYREAPHARLFAQNRNRAAAVPEAVMNKYLDRWEVPTRVEAHEVEYALLP